MKASPTTSIVFFGFSGGHSCRPACTKILLITPGERTTVKKLCGKCGAELQEAVGRAKGLVFDTARRATTQRLWILVPGTPTSMNPIKAVKQGLSDETDDQMYNLQPWRCPSCGFVEFYANEKA